MTTRSTVSRLVRVAAALTLFSVAACGSTTEATSGEPNMGGEAAATATTAPPTDEATRPPVDRVDVKMLPEEGQVDSITLLGNEKGEVTGAECAEGYTTLSLALNGSTLVDGETENGTTVETTVTRSGATIEASDKMPSVMALVVNGRKATPISDDVAQATSTTLHVSVSEWEISEITSLDFCLGGSGINAPVLPD